MASCVANMCWLVTRAVEFNRTVDGRTTVFFSRHLVSLTVSQKPLLNPVVHYKIARYHQHLRRTNIPRTSHPNKHQRNFPHPTPMLHHYPPRLSRGLECPQPCDKLGLKEAVWLTRPIEGIPLTRIQRVLFATPAAHHALDGAGERDSLEDEPLAALEELAQKTEVLTYWVDEM